ncbi:helix-turn-helix domain-containing protein [Sphaerisporangium perillae]|uniref:helix-turn-helix domain-containing protein n=1 Tax=Sphaerisporangium perillae TaxID=2935860 RepID=UPI00200DDE63|nr:helix-turn-helix transcriptional regulator [Sphaerisporangium perillae]
MVRELSPTVCRRRLAAELRRLRGEADLNGVQVAKQLRWSTSKMSRIENGQVIPHADDVAALLDRYGTDHETRERLLALARGAAGKAWWESYSDDLPEPVITFVGFEAEADEIWSWQSTVIPGLLQTADYARAVNSLHRPVDTLTPGKVERRTQFRLRRQERLADPDGVRYSTVIDEAVLLRCFGDESVMRGQLRHLLRLTEFPNMTIRVLPLSHPHPVDFSNFVLLRFPEVETLGRLYPDVIYVDDLSSPVLADNEEITFKYTRLLESLEDAALPPDKSVELLHTLTNT